MGIPQIHYITEQEYLDAERLALNKHEYYKGEVFPLHRYEDTKGEIVAISGASKVHNEISANCIYELKHKLKGKPCRPYGSDLRVNIPENTLYTYPDISVYCNEAETLNNETDTAINPIVIFEILSKTTRSYDLGQKFELYRQIETLKEYILIDSEQLNVIKYYRNQDQSWLMTEYKSIQDSFEIEALEIKLRLSDIYDNVKFEVT
ncbi:Uma2 family endonuclease [Flavobacterium sp.]|jgi:Uma2 family endonuclease|uniref:Uma2 family endonuclease n=1 Tax=Flavobacterium sp. TaxID=239 RepID=UPI0037C0A5B2